MAVDMYSMRNAYFLLILGASAVWCLLLSDVCLVGDAYFLLILWNVSLVMAFEVCSMRDTSCLSYGASPVWCLLLLYLTSHGNLGCVQKGILTYPVEHHLSDVCCCYISLVIAIGMCSERNTYLSCGASPVWCLLLLYLTSHGYWGLLREGCLLPICPVEHRLSYVCCCYISVVMAFEVCSMRDAYFLLILWSTTCLMFAAAVFD